MTDSAPTDKLHAERMQKLEMTSQEAKAPGMAPAAHLCQISLGLWVAAVGEMVLLGWGGWA